MDQKLEKTPRPKSYQLLTKSRYEMKEIVLHNRYMATTLNYHHTTPYPSLFPVTG